MVGRLTLDQEVGVRVPAPQPQEAAANSGFSVATVDSGSSSISALVPIRAQSSPRTSSSIRARFALALPHLERETRVLVPHLRHHVDRGRPRLLEQAQNVRLSEWFVTPAIGGLPSSSSFTLARAIAGWKSAG